MMDLEKLSDQNFNWMQSEGYITPEAYRRRTRRRYKKRGKQ